MNRPSAHIEPGSDHAPAKRQRGSRGGRRRANGSRRARNIEKAAVERQENWGAQVVELNPDGSIERRTGFSANLDASLETDLEVAFDDKRDRRAHSDLTPTYRPDLAREMTLDGNGEKLATSRKKVGYAEELRDYTANPDELKPRRLRSVKGSSR